jgi:tetratricopeptide (TPR) repeat protein
VGLSAVLSLLTLAHVAWAQGVTARDLIGKYVDLGPKHNDVEQAIKRFQAGASKDALEMLKAAAKKNPELPPGQVLFAELCERFNAPDAMRQALEQAVAEVPADPEAYIALAELALRAGRVAEGEALYDKGVALTKSFSGNPKRKSEFQNRVYNGLAAIAESRDKWDPAVTYLSAWSKNEGDNPAIFQRLGRAQFMAKKYNDALASFKKAKQLDKDGKLLAPEVAMGRMYEQAGDRQNAAKHMAEAAKNGANDLQTQLATGEWALETSQVELAKQRADAALKIDPKSRDAKILRGLVARLEKDYRTAKQSFESAHLLEPTNFVCLNQLALALIELPDQTEKRRALEYAQTNAKLYPAQPDAFSTLGWVYHRLGDDKSALNQLNEVAKAGALSADGAYYVAKIYTELGRPEEAQKFLQAALGGKISFAYRKDAESLMTALGKQPAASGALE